MSNISAMQNNQNGIKYLQNLSEIKSFKNYSLKCYRNEIINNLFIWILINDINMIN